jgi:putative transposase
MKTLQKFALVHANIHNHYILGRHLVDRQTYKETPLSRTGCVAGSR